MAYLDVPREFDLACASRVASVFHAWRNTVMRRFSTDCPLCQGRAVAGELCVDCEHDLTWSMHDGRLRCAVCALPLISSRICPDCIAHPAAFDRVIAAFDYAEPGDLLIHRFKMEKQFAYARMLSAVLARQIDRTDPGLPRHTIVTAVPSSAASIRRRGFNPAAEVARSLSRRMMLDYRPGLLCRVREGGRQTHLTRPQRILNTHDMYRCCGPLEGVEVAVVDDVLTTGSTAHGIARQLKAAGAVSVSVLVLARTPYQFAT